MKRFAIALATVVILLVGGTLAPVVSAHPSAPMRPAYMYCTSTTWTVHYSNTHTYSGTDENGHAYSWYGQGILETLVDATNHNIFCGEANSGANVTLTVGCVDWYGGAYTGTGTSYTNTWGPIYHCTHTSYNFLGSPEPATCDAYSNQLYSMTSDFENGLLYVGPYACNNP